LDFIVRSGKILDLQVYYNRPTELENFKYVDFLKTYNISSTLPLFYQDNTNNCRNNVLNDRHYFKVYINDNDDVYAYIYIPINKVKRCVRLEMFYRTSGEIYYLCLLLLHKPSRGDKDNLTYITVRGGGEPLVCASYQQSTIAHGIMDSIDNVRLTFDDMCEFGTAAQCRSYIVVLTLHGYETHAIFDNDEQRSFMYMDCIQFHKVQTIENDQVLMLQDLERLFCKSRSSLSKFGFPTPRRVPTEVEEAILKWCNEDEMEKQEELVGSLNLSCPNNAEQQNGDNNIMNSIDEFRNTEQDLLTSH
jgi:hypothetical protein